MTQQMEALDKANRVRYAIRDVKAELASGILPLRDALADDRVITMVLHKLLASQKSWGPTRANALCNDASVSPLRPVGGLTEREADRIALLAPMGTKERRLALYRMGPEKVLKEANNRGWRPRLEDLGVVVITPLGEAVLSDLEDLSFLAAELEAA